MNNMETKKEVKCFLVSRNCPKCQGEMISEGEVLFSNPPYYKHKCKECNHPENYLKTYPYIDYE